MSASFRERLGCGRRIDASGKAARALLEWLGRSFERRLLQALFITFALTMTAVAAQAQGRVTALEQLTVDIWPDYDQPAVLVLLTGMLPAGAPSPATITLPLPADATINAVARIAPNGNMLADIDFDDSTPGQLTLTTPDPRFRVEYYVPYVTDGDQHSFVFQWLSDVTVNQIAAVVQQPPLAAGLTLAPEAAGVTTGGDGLQYHALPPTAVPAGESYSLEASYALASPQLTVDILAAQEAAADTTVTGPEPAVTPDTGIDWLIVVAVAGALLAAAAVVWLVVSKRNDRRRVVKPRPIRRAPRTASAPSSPLSGSGARFCHECGRPLEEGDRFCRNCGTVVKELN